MRLGIDIGGTFTDFVLRDEATGALRFGKVLTTHADPTDGIVAGMCEVLAAAGVDAAALTGIVHGTTLVTNAVIERKGARTGLLATEGFRDVLELGRELRYDLYDLALEMPEPLVPRDLRLGVRERVDARGRVLVPLDEAHLAAAGDALVAAGVESVAVCFLHAYANPAHERRAAEVLRQRHPGLHVSLSSDVLPEIREYERASATAMNAYVRPLTDRYLERLDGRLRAEGFTGTLHLMLSSGRLTTVEEARARPIGLLESGPAGGAMAAAVLGAETGEPALLAFDMGGTTAKAALVRDGRPEITTEFEAAHVRRFKRGSGLPVRIPVVDLIEIGAGGGSVAWVDALGLLRVGPESAGSEPGPACYGRGGTRPTVTDADLVLGYLDPDFFLGGAMRLDVEAARDALRHHVAEPLGLSVEDAALGVHRVVNESMANAARVHTLSRGHDPRRFTMVAFGGAGPVHAFQVARRLHLRRLLVPVGAGVTSALGFLVAPVATEAARSRVGVLDGGDWAGLTAVLAEMEAEGRAFLADAGVPVAGVLRQAELRYRGQGHEVTVDLPDGGLMQASLPEIADRFASAYARLYGRALDDVPIEGVTWRVLASGPAPDLSAAPPAAAGDAPAARQRRVRFPEHDAPVACPVVRRAALAPGDRVEGPVIVEERESTLVVGPDARVRVLPGGHLLVELDPTPAATPVTAAEPAAVAA